MKRLPAPNVKRVEGMPDDAQGIKIIRDSPPMHWILGEWAFHIITLCLDAYGEITAQALLNAVTPPGKAISTEDSFLNNTYGIAYDKNRALYTNFIASFPEEEVAAWNPDTYFEIRKKGVPQYEVFIDVGAFLFREYRHMPDDLRVVTELAFSGFLLSTVTGPAFADVCADKGLDVSALAAGQRMDVPLDHEALYHALLVKLGHG